MPRPALSRRSLLPLLIAGLAFLTLAAACSSGTRRSGVTASPTLAAGLRAPATAAASGTAAAPPAAASTAAVAAPATAAPPAQVPAQASAPPSGAAAATPAPAAVSATPVLIAVPTPPPPDSTPCKSGQIKGDRATKTFYTPGLIGYNDHTSNVDCFDTIDAATSAGYHLPSR